MSAIIAQWYEAEKEEDEKLAVAIESRASSLSYHCCLWL